MALSQSLLLQFFRKSTQELRDLTILEPKSLEELRQLVLDIQRSCLEELVVSDISQALVELKQLDPSTLDSETRDAMEENNEAARQTLCRLVLDAECRRQIFGSDVLQKTLLSRSDLLEFMGLVTIAMQLDEVQTYLKTNKLFEKESSTQLVLHERVEYIQHLLLQALGYDAQYLRRDAAFQQLFTLNGPYANDKQIMMVLENMISSIQAALNNIAVPTMLLSDEQDGGVTRVVAVQHVELDESGRVLESDGVPTSHTMEGHDDKASRELLLARETAVLHQEILGELMTMSEEDRNTVLIEARAAARDFLGKVVELPVGAERVRFMQSLDSHTQRLLVIDKVWSALLAQHGGKPPTIHHRGI